MLNFRWVICCRLLQCFSYSDRSQCLQTWVWVGGHHRTTNIETYTVQYIYIQAIYVPTGISHCHFDDDFQTHHTCHMVFVNSEENPLWWIPGAWFWPACIHLSPQVLALGCWCCWWVFWGLFLNVIFSWWWWCQMFDCWSPFFAFFCQGDCRNSFFGLEGPQTVCGQLTSSRK